MIFPFKKKGFPRKSLYSCVVVLPLYLLKFIHSYIEFFPNIMEKKYAPLAFLVVKILILKILLVILMLGSGDSAICMIAFQWVQKNKKKKRVICNSKHCFYIFAVHQ